MARYIMAFSPGLMDPKPEEQAMAKADRRGAMQGNNVSSMWLPGHHPSNARNYLDPELKRKYTSKPRTLSGAELERAKAEIMASRKEK